MAKVLSNLRITQHYGNNGHTGVDLGATSDKKVFANADGTVSLIQTGIPNAKGSTGMRSYGNCIFIKHPNNMYTRYAHLQTVQVKKGQAVKAGQQIGIQGNTGNSYGIHLHYEVLRGSTRLNPESYMQTAVYQTPANNTKTTTSYYPKYTGKSVSIVEALNSLKINSSYSNRSAIAKKNGISGYKGTASQNIKMLNLLKQGKLVK